MFKIVATSRKKGLLKSNLNIALISLHLIFTAAAVVLLLGAINEASTPLNLRYSTDVGPYDRGEWSRVLLLVVFSIINLVTTFMVAHRLLPLKKPNLATAFLVVGVVVSILVMIISLQYAAYSQI